MHKPTPLILNQLRPLHNLIKPQTLGVVCIKRDALAGTTGGAALVETAS